MSQKSYKDAYNRGILDGRAAHDDNPYKEGSFEWLAYKAGYHEGRWILLFPRDREGFLVDEIASYFVKSAVDGKYYLLEGLSSLPQSLLRRLKDLTA
jgi:hypothetical protein